MCGMFHAHMNLCKVCEHQPFHLILNVSQWSIQLLFCCCFVREHGSDWLMWVGVHELNTDFSGSFIKLELSTTFSGSFIKDLLSHSGPPTFFCVCLSFWDFPWPHSPSIPQLPVHTVQKLWESWNSSPGALADNSTSFLTCFYSVHWSRAHRVEMMPWTTQMSFWVHYCSWLFLLSCAASGLGKKYLILTFRIFSSAAHP